MADTLQFIPTVRAEQMALIVKGRVYDRWKTARITFRTDAPFGEFQFTASEAKDIYYNWDSWDIRNGDPVKAVVGGYVVVDGYVDIREVFYDAHEHGVMIYGRDYNANAFESSVRMGSGEPEVQLINATFTQIMERALQGLGTKIDAPGDDGTIFPNFSIAFGETPWGVGERVKRYIPALRITSNPRNRTWVAHTTHTGGGGGATFVEGDNILSARLTIDSTHWMKDSHTLGQQPGRDERKQKEAAEVEGKAQDGSLPPAADPRYVANALPDPANKKMADGYARHELIQRAEDAITCTIRVYGWFERSGQLFDIHPFSPGYTVDSPMLGMDQNPLWARMVMFEQNDATGSTTTIELCNKAALYSYGERGGPPPGVGNLGPSTNYGGQGVPFSKIMERYGQ